MSDQVIKNLYLPTVAGQIHARVQPARGEEREPPLICLHPAPASGLYFTNVMPLLNAERRIVAPDYPGYGGSYSLTNAPSISDYANAIIESVIEAEAEGPVDLLGFHTGCLVAVEASLLASGRIRKLILIDVPFFRADAQEMFRAQMTVPLPLAAELSCLEQAWDFNVTRRLADVPLERAFALLVESLRAGNHDYFGFHAAFSYDCTTRFANAVGEATILATRSGLLDASHAAAAAMPNARLVDVMNVTSAVFEKSAADIAARILEALADD